jgi:putative cardiolipin synthase
MAAKTWVLCMCLALAGIALAPRAAADDAMAFAHDVVAAHPGESGAYVLETGEEALIARAWLGDHARRSIDIQYFIWSTDNIGILAAEAILRAADRGVHARILVDDLLIDAPPESLLALAKHPNIEIRIYNPNTSVGVPLRTRVWNAVTDFRGVNQRMHDKTLIVDGTVAITGGRNMAADYYDYSQEYCFRDRDVLLAGEVVKDMSASFERFWASPLAHSVESLYDGIGLMQENVKVDAAEVQRIYRELHAYAADPSNFAPEVRAAIDGAPAAFARIAEAATWGDVEFVSDLPGKNETHEGLGGGGRTTAALARLVESARERLAIQSPYLVPSDAALELLREVLGRGVRIRVNTNSLASTDNLQAFAGYRNLRDSLLAMGLQIFEYRPDPETQRRVMQQEVIGRLPAEKPRVPVFGLHAKTLVVDGKVAFIGTFNLDPRSENLNTEVGVIIHDESLARAVEAAIETDMQPANSWNAATDDPDQFVPLGKRNKVRFWQLLPIKPIL